MTIFKTIPTFDSLEISDCGTIVRDIATKTPIKITKNGAGYHLFAVPRTGHRVYVHRSVLMAHDRLPLRGEIARHLDDNRDDNRISNLAWGTHRENYIDAVRNQRTGAQKRAKACFLLPGIMSVTAAIQDPEDIKEIRRGFWLENKSQTELSREFGIAQNTISQIVTFKTYQGVVQEDEVEVKRAESKAKPKGHSRIAGTGKLAETTAGNLENSRVIGLVVADLMKEFAKMKASDREELAKALKDKAA